MESNLNSTICISILNILYAFIRLYVAKFNDAFDIYTMSLGFFKNRNFNLREQKLKSTLYQSTNEFNAFGTTYWLSNIDNSQNLVIQRTHTCFEFQVFLTDYILEILSIQFIRNLNSVHCTFYKHKKSSYLKKMM